MFTWPMPALSLANGMKKKNIIILVIVLVLIFGGLVALKVFKPEATCWPYCGQAKVDKTGKGDAPIKTGLPNPASVHCEEVGGTLAMDQDSSGGQVGFCTLPDKSVCEEWALLRNECADNSEHFLHLSVRPGDKISSPLKITGESGGGWFNEGSFPINIVDWDGKIIATGIATAKADWMTTKFVPFDAELTFTSPANVSGQSKNKGAIIFKKDNPSGLPQNDAAYELPITF